MGKQNWCCQNKQKACPGDPSPPGPASGSAEVQPADASFDCDEGLANAAVGWSDPKKEWCCANQQKGCGLTEDYDCEAGFWNWQNGWSEEKKTWCCQNKQKACPGDPSPPGPASGSAVVQPAAASWDCDEGLANAAIGWSVPKKEWCCANQQKGCSLTEDYDCEAGDWNWQNGWSEEKKTWCCQNQQRGCPGDPVPLPPASDPTTSPTSQPGVDLYDCEAGFANWENGWSEDKKNWCCQNKQTKTCPGDPAPQ